MQAMRKGATRARRQAGPARSHQRGMTTLGLIILVAFIGLFAFAAIRLTPVYLNYMKVSGVVDGVFEEFDGQNASASLIRKSVARRFSVESVSVIAAKDVTVTAEKGGHRVTADYTHTVPFISNISFAVDFNKSQLVRR